MGGCEDIDILLYGGSKSYLKRAVGKDLYQYIEARGLWRTLPGRAEHVVVDGVIRDVVEDEDGNLYGYNDDDDVLPIEVSPHDVILYQVDLARFLTKLLGLDFVQREVSLKNEVSQGSGAYLLIQLRFYGVDIYYVAGNKDSQYYEIERLHKQFGKNVVIISPEDTPPQTYATKMGNCQFRSIDGLLDRVKNNGGHDMPITCLVEPAYKSVPNKPPYVYYPYKIRDDVTWSDIQLTLHADSVDISMGGKPPKTIACANLDFAKAPLTKDSPVLLRYSMLMGLAYLQQWVNLDDRERQHLKEINDSLQVFFHQPTPFYGKRAGDGLNHLRLTLKLDKDLQGYCAELVRKVRQERMDSSLAKLLTRRNFAQGETGESIAYDSSPHL